MQGTLKGREVKMSDKNKITFHTEKAPHEKLTTLDIVVSALSIAVTFVFLTAALGTIVQPLCVILGFEYSWIVPAIIAVVIIIVLCTR
jgi:hypothetical protein